MKNKDLFERQVKTVEALSNASEMLAGQVMQFVNLKTNDALLSRGLIMSFLELKETIDAEIREQAKWLECYRKQMEKETAKEDEE